MRLGKVGQRLLAVSANIVVAFLILPILVVIPLSFTPGTVLDFPPDGLSLRWYQDFFGDERWINATWLSLRLGVAVAITSTALGLLAAVALTRYIKRGAFLVRGLLVAPLIVPPIVTAVAVVDRDVRVGLLRTSFSSIPWIDTFHGSNQSSGFTSVCHRSTTTPS